MLTRLAFAGFLALCIPATAPAQSGDVLTGWTRTGSVYQRISLIQGTPAMCAALCDEDGQCRSWAFTPAGLDDVDSRCALLASTPTPRPAPQRVTGLASDIATRIEAAAERPPSPREITALRATLPGPH
ncbi:PAN domain-containing protein [uncultured Maricaulis sp.]|uniref:PAN domain-containing protein n=1 Tax=uncultured Maricaulis sp. TaxID=174710 RepID=UPI0030DBAF5E|tara:strand:- start:117129 stop:117515 length:387 start_codon:yes stop_codon:yes gene_type:complete